MSKSCLGCDGSGWTVVAGVPKPCPLHAKSRVTENRTPRTSPAPPAYQPPAPPATATAPSDDPVVNDWDTALGTLCPGCGTIVGKSNTLCVKCLNDTAPKASPTGITATGQTPPPATDEPQTPASSPPAVSKAKKVASGTAAWATNTAAPKAWGATQKVAPKLGNALLHLLSTLFTIMGRFARRNPLIAAIIACLTIVVLTNGTSMGDSFGQLAVVLFALYVFAKVLKHFVKK